MFVLKQQICFFQACDNFSICFVIIYIPEMWLPVKVESGFASSTVYVRPTAPVLSIERMVSRQLMSSSG